jgi:hypothetical protein
VNLSRQIRHGALHDESDTQRTMVVGALISHRIERVADPEDTDGSAVHVKDLAIAVWEIRDSRYHYLHQQPPSK